MDQRGPGLVLLTPTIDRMVRVSLRTVTLTVPPQETITRDNIPVRVTAVVYYRVVDANSAVTQVESFHNATLQIAQTTLRSVLGGVDLDSLLAERDRLNESLQHVIDAQTEPWGIKVTTVEIRDVEIPERMQHAIARQAEAERERRAKIINAEGEFQAAAKLAEAADVIGRNPTTLQLRYLQTLREIGANQNSTVVFPIDLVKPALDAITGVAAAAAQGNSAQAGSSADSTEPAVNGELSPGSAGQLGAGPAPRRARPRPVPPTRPRTASRRCRSPTRTSFGVSQPAQRPTRTRADVSLANIRLSPCSWRYAHTVDPPRPYGLDRPLHRDRVGPAPVAGCGLSLRSSTVTPGVAANVPPHSPASLTRIRSGRGRRSSAPASALTSTVIASGWCRRATVDAIVIASRTGVKLSAAASAHAGVRDRERQQRRGQRRGRRPSAHGRSPSFDGWRNIVAGVAGR